MQDFSYFREVRSQSRISLPASLKELSKLAVCMFRDGWPESLKVERAKVHSATDGADENPRITVAHKSNKLQNRLVVVLLTLWTTATAACKGVRNSYGSWEAKKVENI